MEAEQTTQPRLPLQSVPLGLLKTAACAPVQTTSIATPVPQMPCNQAAQQALSTAIDQLTATLVNLTEPVLEKDVARTSSLRMFDLNLATSTLYSTPPSHDSQPTYTPPFPLEAQGPSPPLSIPAAIHPMSVNNLIHSDPTVALPPCGPQHQLNPLLDVENITENDRNVVLGGGYTLTYNFKDIPDPPALRLAKMDMHMLIRWWDDPSPEWLQMGTLFESKSRVSLSNIGSRSTVVISVGTALRNTGICGK